MPVHDWSRVAPGIFHNFHHGWTCAITNTLNTGGLPDEYCALIEPTKRGSGPEAISRYTPSKLSDNHRGVAISDTHPRARFKVSAEVNVYAAIADRIAIHRPLGEVIAIIEIVSPGNKSGRHALRSFVEKARAALDQGIHVLVVDLFPPGPRDPQGIHKAIWDEVADEPFELPKDKPLTVAAYMGGLLKTAYVEPFAVADPVPEMPIFLSTEMYVPAPLEVTYQATWSASPPPVKELLLSAAR